jgi:hypothetical protein
MVFFSKDDDRPSDPPGLCARGDDVTGLALRIHQAILDCPGLDDQLLRINRPQVP